MGVTTTADEHVSRAREHIERARKEIGAVLIDRQMWGADDYRNGFFKNVFDRLDATSRAIDGEDAEGDARAAVIPPP